MTAEKPGDPEALQESRSRIVAQSNATRRWLERRLHDGPQQHLVAMAVKLRLIENSLDDTDAARAMLEELRGEVQDAVQQLRDIATAIFPPLLTDRGLTEALRAAASREGGWAEIHVDDSAGGRYPTEVEAGVYFAAVDALHMATGPVSLAIAETDGALHVTMRGELPDEALLHVADRVQAVGGRAMRDGDGIVAIVPIT